MILTRYRDIDIERYLGSNKYKKYTFNYAAINVNHSTLHCCPKKVLFFSNNSLIRNRPIFVILVTHISVIAMFSTLPEQCLYADLCFSYGNGNDMPYDCFFLHF